MAEINGEEGEPAPAPVPVPTEGEPILEKQEAEQEFDYDERIANILADAKNDKDLLPEHLARLIEYAGEKNKILQEDKEGRIGNLESRG